MESSFAAITADEDTTTSSNDADNSDYYYLANGFHGRPASSYLRGGINRRRNDQLIDDADFYYNSSYNDDVMMNITASSSSSNNTNTNTNNSYSNNTNTTNYHIIIMIALIGLIVVLAMNMLYLMYKPTYLKYVQRKLFPNYYNKNQSKLMERRYYAIDKWLIQKTIQPHDDICECIQNYCRQKNGKSSLGIIFKDNTTIDTPTSLDDDSLSFPPICLTTSFETLSTSADSSSCRCDNSRGSDIDTDIECAVVVPDVVVENRSGIEILHSKLDPIIRDTDTDDDILEQIVTVKKNALKYGTIDSDSISGTTDCYNTGTSIGIEVAYNNLPRTASQSTPASAALTIATATAEIMKGGKRLERDGTGSGIEIISKQEHEQRTMNGIIQRQHSQRQQQQQQQHPLLTRVQILTKMEIMKKNNKHHHHRLVVQQQQQRQRQRSTKKNNDDEPDDGTPTTKDVNDVLVLTSNEDRDDDDDDCLSYPDGSDDDDDDESEGLDLHSKPSCSICMESFKAGDKISISPTINCPHIFHHNCIREWLLRKKACPCCRIIMLPIDRRPSTTSTAIIISTSTAASTPTPTLTTTITSTTTETTEIETILQERQRYRNINKVEKKKKKKTVVEAKYISERTNRKCGTYFCIDCGLIQLKKELREDLLLPGRKKMNHQRIIR